MRLTDIAIKRLPAPPRGNKITYDDAVKGFGIRITAGDARAFVLNYRRKLDGRERRVTIGSYPDWSTATAREEAKRLKREIDGGADRVGEQEESRAAADRCRSLRAVRARLRPAQAAIDPTGLPAADCR